jgi:hypothetical protein
MESESSVHEIILGRLMAMCMPKNQTTQKTPLGVCSLVSTNLHPTMHLLLLVLSRHSVSDVLT